MSDTDHLVFRFKEHLQVLDRSAATVTAYVKAVKAFLSALGETDMRKVTRSMVEAYVAGLYDKSYRTATICMKVRSIKRFFEFLEKANLIFVHPAEALQEPKRSKSLVKDILTPGEAREVLDQPNLGTFTGIRDRTILEVFYSTGIRLKELCSLSIYDADLQGQMVRVNQGKGKKDRVVPMGKHAVRFLREYVAKVRPHFTRRRKTESRSQEPVCVRTRTGRSGAGRGTRNQQPQTGNSVSQTGNPVSRTVNQKPGTRNRKPGCKPELNRFLFVDRYGKQISPQVVEIMVRNYARAAGIRKQVTPHTFRHSFATSLIRNGADITAVQKMLGHACLSTTQVYIRTLGLDVKRAHRKTHPREKDKEKIAVPKVSHRPLR